MCQFYFSYVQNKVNFYVLQLFTELTMETDLYFINELINVFALE